MEDVRPTKREKMFAVLPTMLTLGNAACGFGAITFAAKVGPTVLGEPSTVTTGYELFIAALLIFLAMIFDALDGSAARWTRQSSDFGAQLDSLCDALSFGAAPAFLMLQVVLKYKLETVDPLINYPPRLLWVIAVLFMMCALLRLARFNVETDEDDSHDFFSGLPSPAAAAVVASFPIAISGVTDPPNFLRGEVTEIAGWLIPAVKLILPWVTLAAACLMVSRVRYPHVFNQFVRGRRSRAQIFWILFVVVAVFAVHELLVPLLACYFAFAAPLRALWGETVAARLYKSRET